MIFLLFMVAGTLLIASAAVFFSVLGLVQTFSETAIYWGTAIEVAKLLLASFLYRFWDKSNTVSKVVNIGLIVFLMTITSLGIYGHIITSYQEGNLQVVNQNIQLDSAEEKLSRIRDKIDLIDTRIDSNKLRLNYIEDEISKVPDNYVTVRRELIQEREPEKKEIQNRIDELFEDRETLFDDLEKQQDTVADLKMETGVIENKVGPIMFVVETLGATGEKAIFWFVLIIVLSFDPAAVALTVYTNKVSLDIEDKKKKFPTPTPIPLTPTPTPTVSHSVTPTPTPTVSHSATPTPSVSTSAVLEQQETENIGDLVKEMHSSIKNNNDQLRKIQERFDKDEQRQKMIEGITRKS